MTNLLTQAGANVTQNREQYIGGSDVPIILGLSKYKTQYELAKEKLGLTKSEYKGNEYTQYGKILEPQIRDYINAVYEMNFIEQTVTGEGIRSNTDGYDKEHGMILEIKTHGKQPTIEAYEAQMQLYMYQLNCSSGWLALYERPKDFDVEFDNERLQIKTVHRDDAYIDKILATIETFWTRCDFLKENPEATEAQFYSFGANELNVIANQVYKFEAQLAGFKEIEKRYKDAKQRLHDAMERNDIKKFETDHVVITRTLPTERRSIDTKRLKEEQPEVAVEYEKVTKVAGGVRIKLKEAN
ncbi:YqaJ viral recombinase family protein [Halalkalibacterium halodurans]|uniref:YqaJ viral recombinase family protein n=1 Tax=Halalkalibacterium halodurans TaxID=86665 RepID=UPI002AA9FFC4|nr:YqaJ viral recombinase family protein [Halalkalibacterium halodurans]MDY7224690.1 YqaJ viral recombinase family protein [Halalkalibacterium halodurans]MDY7243260.1 YqaJ viral recombinase family protein [Halalkalibacterium halodurans]